MDKYIDSDRNKLLLELRESERRYFTLLSNLPGMSYRCKNDHNWTMEFVSEGAYALTGYKPEDFHNNNKLSFNDIICEEYQELLWNKWQQILKDKQVFQHEYTIRAADGEIKWVWEQGIGIFGENGELQAIEGFIIDITERKRKEEEITYLSYHDSLTGLFNRRYFEENVEIMINSNRLPISFIMGDVNGLKLVNDVFGHIEGDRILKTAAEIITNASEKNSIAARWGGDEFILMLPETDMVGAELVCSRINELCSEEKDRIFESTISLGFATLTSMEQDVDQIIKIAENYMYEKKLLENRSLRNSIINSIQKTLYEKSSETEEHAKRLQGLCMKIGEALSLSLNMLNELEVFALLHDIGKIAISDVILNKVESLTAEEWREIKRHPEIGYRISHSTTELSNISDLILSHHERWDGKGYPRGLKGENIPLLCRILAVVDSYDAMTNDRIYKKAISKEKAIKEIKENSGTQFDPEIVKIFIDLVDY